MVSKTSEVKNLTVAVTAARFVHGDNTHSGAARVVEKHYYVYIMANRSCTLYTGVTNDLNRRVFQHKHGLLPGFTSKYHITQLVYFEETGDVRSAIEREKQIKGWLRAKKIALIESANPEWRDLSLDWLEGDSSLRSE